MNRSAYDFNVINNELQKIGEVVVPSINKNIVFTFENYKSKTVSTMFTLPQNWSEVSTQQKPLLENWTLDVSDNLAENSWYVGGKTELNLYELATLSGTKTAQEIEGNVLEKKYVYKTLATKLFQEQGNMILKSKLPAGYYDKDSIRGVFKGLRLTVI